MIMNLTLKKILLYFIILPSAILFFLWFIVLKPYISREINSALNSLNSRMSGDPSPRKDSNPIDVFFLGAKSSSTITLKTRPVPIPLEKPAVELAPLSLITLNPRLKLNSNIFGGQVKGNFSYKINGGGIVADLNAEGLEIARYQLASMLGITAGKINFNIEGKGTNSGELIPAKVFLLIKGFKKPHASKVPAWISPLAIKIPAIDEAELTAAANCDFKECRSSRFSISSSLGQANGSFSMQLKAGAIPQLNLTVALTQAGKTELLPYFALANQQLLSFPDKPFIVKLAEQDRKPKLSVVPMADSL